MAIEQAGLARLTEQGWYRSLHDGTSISIPGARQQLVQRRIPRGRSEIRASHQVCAATPAETRDALAAEQDPE